MASLFSTLFIGMLAFSIILRLWLALRQQRHVLAHRADVPTEFAGRISLAEHQKAADYTRAKLRLGMLEIIADALLLLLLTLGGWLNSFDGLWRSIFTDNAYAQGLALFASFALVGFAVGLPFTLYRTFVIEARFGFNKMTPRLFITDLAKQLLLTLVIAAPLLLLVLWLMDIMGNEWWLYVWACWFGFSLLMLLLYPTFIAPLFNKFSPLAESEVKTRIESLLERCGFSSSGLFVMDGSKRSAHGNAYFTGFGRAKRIVFFDTLLEKLAPAEIEAVLAHELGHFKRRHVTKRIVVMGGISLALLWLLGRLIHQEWFFVGLNIEHASTAMALLLFSLILPVFSFPFTPLQSWLSRRQEFEADDYAAQQADSTDLISALVKLYRDNAATLTPDRLHSLFYDSHPPASVRIAHLKSS